MEAKLEELLVSIAGICKDYSYAYDMFFDSMRDNKSLPDIAMLPEQDNRRAAMVKELHQVTLLLAEYYGKFKNEHTRTQNYCLEQLIYQPTQKARTIDIDNVLLWCLYTLQEFENE